MPRKKSTEKKWYQSKTFWIGVFEIIGGIHVALLGHLTTGGVLTAAGIIEIILRSITKTGITK